MIARLKKYFVYSPKQNNLNTTFKPLYVVLSLLGLFPFSVKFQNHSFTIIHKSIYINALCAFTVILTICALLSLHIEYIYLSFEDNSMTDEIMTQYNYILELVALTVYCLVAYISSFVNRYKIVTMLSKIAKWTEPTNSYSDKILKYLRHKIYSIMGILLFLLLIQISVNCTRDDSMWKIILVLFTFNLPQMVQFTSIAFYHLLVCMVVAIINSLTDHINVLTKGKLVTNCFMNGQSKSTLNLKQLESIYVQVFEVKQEINKVFEGSILVTTMQCFHSMVSESYIIYHGIIQQTLSTHEILNCSLWIFYQVLKIYVLSNSGSLLKIAVKKLGQELYNIPTEKNDLRLLAEIQHFSTLMSYHESELSVYGFFPLDASLMFKIIASATMYLIILVQFDKKGST